MWRSFWSHFRIEERAQDLAEYCMITALVALAALAVFYKVSGNVTDWWTVANTTLVTANTSNTAASAGAATASQPGDPHLSSDAH
ncbi:MAG TPA: hypothetical protein VG675_20625 [Bryobacteraceae bacterium]|nr:hypothetical protein [Bryobacteraceae bacterium]